jgi:hypothetical protein
VAKTTAAEDHNGHSGDSDEGGDQATSAAYGRTPLWRSDGSYPVGERRQVSEEEPSTLNQTVFITQVPSSSSSLSTHSPSAGSATETVPTLESGTMPIIGEKEVTALMDIVTALCVQQKENEASLEEVTVVMGELERKWRSEQRENEKERRQARRHYEENMKKRDVEIMRMREELKRERCLREMAEDRVKRAEDVAKAGIHALSFLQSPPFAFLEDLSHTHNPSTVYSQRGLGVHRGVRPGKRRQFPSTCCLSIAVVFAQQWPGSPGCCQGGQGRGVRERRRRSAILRERLQRRQRQRCG